MSGSLVSNPGHPRQNNVLDLGGMRKNHTHPSEWAQPPSRQDIKNTSEGDRRYVWGMGSQTLYIITNKGVVATVPFAIYFK